jgi:hypothetical protein
MSDPTSCIPTTGPFLEVIGDQLPGGDALCLGAFHGNCDMRCNGGQLNEARVFDRAQTAEIRALYTNET